MNPTFHLYGMKITLAGDLTAARDRAHLARLLMFKTKLVNVNNLDIIQNNLRLNDGTHVHFMSQHGFDSATIYVPPKPTVPVPGKRKWVEQFIWPAFEVYTGTGDSTEFKGLVICRGGGFNPPYEYVKVDKDDLADFYDGAWYKGGWQRHFDTVDDYLAPNLFFSQSNPSPSIIEKKYEDLGAAGSQSAVFRGMKSPVLSEITYVPPTVVPNCHAPTYTYNCFMDVQRIGHLEIYYSYSVPTDAKNNPDYEMPEYSYSYFDDREVTEIGYAEDGFVADAGKLIRNNFNSLSGFNYGDYSNWKIIEFSSVTTIIPDSVDGPGLLFDPDEHDITYDLTREEPWKYNRAMTSAVDDQRYFFLDSQYEDSYSFDADDLQPRVTSDPVYEFHCSGTVFDVTPHIDKWLLYANVRYYEVGSMGYYAAAVTYYPPDSPDDTDSCFVSYFFYSGKKGNINGAEPVKIEALSGLLPENVTDDEGNPLSIYNGSDIDLHSFRLIRETVTYEEDL